MSSNSEVEVNQFVELISSTIESSMSDIKNFHKFSNPSNIKDYISTKKKSPTCIVSSTEMWHPSQVSYAYEYLFDEDYVVTRNDISYSLRTMAEKILRTMSWDSFSLLIRTRLAKDLGGFVAPGFPLSIEVITGDLDGFKIGREYLCQIVAMTYAEEIHWEKSDTLSSIDKLGEQEVYVAHNVPIKCEGVTKEVELKLVMFAKLTRGSIKNRIYREYFLEILFDNGDKSFVAYAGKLWRIVVHPDYRKSITSISYPKGG